MSKSTAMDLVMQFMGRQNTIPIPVPFVQLLGDYAAAAFLAQCLYWTDRSTEKDGWFYKSREEWAEELCMTEKQVRRCMEACGAYLEVERRGIPARNFYRPKQAEIAEALSMLKGQQQKPKRANKTGPKGPNCKAPEGQQVGQKKGQLYTEPTSETTQNPQQIKNTLAAGAAAGELDRNPETLEPQNPNPTTPAADLRPVQDSSEALQELSPATDPEQVPPAAPPAPGQPSSKAPARRLSDPARIIAAWNEHRGQLPEVQGLNEGRKKAIRKLIRDCEGDINRAAALVSDATREVAADGYWTEHRYGFDNLVPGKVFGRAEAWRSRQGQPTVQTSTSVSANHPLTTSIFHVGQRVTYKRDAYTVEQVTDTYVDLYDDENGSSRVLLSSSDWAAIRPLGGQK